MFSTLMENKPLVELFDEMQGVVSHDICTAGALVFNVAVWIKDNQLGRETVCQHRCPQSIADNRVLWNFQKRLYYSWDTLDLPSGKVSQIRKIKGSSPSLVQQHILQAIHNLQRVRVMHWELDAYSKTQEEWLPFCSQYEIKNLYHNMEHIQALNTWYFPVNYTLWLPVNKGINGISNFSRHFASHTFPGNISSFRDTKLFKD